MEHKKTKILESLYLMRRINVKATEKEIVKNIILKKYNLSNITNAMDIPDFRLYYQNTYPVLLVIRHLKTIIPHDITIKVIKGKRYICYNNNIIELCTFIIGDLPKLDESVNKHIIIAVSPKLDILYICGYLFIELNNMKQFNKDFCFTNNRYFGDLDLLIPMSELPN